jgi:hypothetical protein
VFRRHAAACLIVFALVLGDRQGLAASEHYGQVTFGGLPVPGATVTAWQGDKQFVTSTDQQGVYKMADLADGPWTIKVEMLGFAPLSQEVTIATGSPHRRGTSNSGRSMTSRARFRPARQNATPRTPRSG